MSIYAQLLMKRYGGALDAEADRFLQFLQNASGRMSALVRDLLAYARLITEEQRPVSVALDDDLEAALTLLNQAIAESGAMITHDALPILKVDRGQWFGCFKTWLETRSNTGNQTNRRKYISAPKREGQNR